MTTLKNTILITGGTSGLGYSAALDIAQQRPGDRIIIASRSNADSADASINKTLHQSNVQYMALDLSSLANVRTFVADYTSKKYGPITSLVLNAGLQFPGKVSYTAEGIEKTFAVNHVGHSLLFYLLRPQLATDCRIVITASGTHDPAQKTGLQDAYYPGGEELAHPSKESVEKNTGRQRYATSKLCNVLWMYALHRHLEKVNASGKRWSVNAFDPGLMPGTGLARDTAAPLRFVFTKVLPHVIPLLRVAVSANVHSAKESGHALARLAVGKDVAGVSGTYFEGMKQIDSSVESREVEKQDELWSWTLKYVARDEDEVRAFDAV